MNPNDPVFATILFWMKADLVTWGLALIGVLLVSWAYLRLLDLAKAQGDREAEAWYADYKRRVPFHERIR
jgi:hypothetical protein